MERTGPFKGRTIAVVNDLSLDEQRYLYRKAAELKRLAREGGDVSPFKINDPDYQAYLIFMQFFGAHPCGREFPYREPENIPKHGKALIEDMRKSMRGTRGWRQYRDRIAGLQPLRLDHYALPFPSGASARRRPSRGIRA